MTKKRRVEQSDEPVEETDDDAPTPTCFVLSVIGDEGTRERRRADQVFKHLIVPAVEEFGYRAFRSDHIPRPGLITSQVIQNVADSDLVIADLTDHNPNVFYELAIRHGLQRPLVQLIDANQTLPFDVAGMRTIFFDIHDLDSVESARGQLVGHIEELLDDDEPIETPVSVARDMKRLWESDNPLAQTVAELMSGLSELRAEMKAQRRHQMPAGTITYDDVVRGGTIIGEPITQAQLDAAGVNWQLTTNPQGIVLSNRSAKQENDRSSKREGGKSP